MENSYYSSQISFEKEPVWDNKRDYKGFVSLLKVENSKAHILIGLIIPMPPIQVGRANKSLSKSPGGE